MLSTKRLVCRSGFTLVCRCGFKHRAPLARGAHLPTKKKLRWMFAYVVQF